ncbi:WD40/YVTN/BNR-like repeat-containing protein [Thalassotalea maritima]|uniref:WD40/YVTN/BNR-like repeat-containing protein n=1 Tax=Thalassotalea maritima TaxID=3242416 RepID=UPI0035294E1B
MRLLYGLLICTAVALAGIYSFSPRHVQPLDSYTLPVNTMRLNDITKSSAGIVVIGELGHILYSNDGGQQWQQANVDKPRFAMLTEVLFITPDVGVAVGHQGWILRTEDGGKNWQEVHFDAERYDPLLTLSLDNDGTLTAVGAFGMFAQSQDQGHNWSFISAPENTDWHLNALINTGEIGKQLLIGEQGVAFLKEAQGNWSSIDPFYNGSLYGGLNLSDDTFLVYGMRGNAFISDDNGQNWRTIENQIPVSLFAHHVLPSGHILLAGQGGTIFLSSAHGEKLQPIHGGKRWSITGMLPLGSNEFLLATNEGVKRVSLTQALAHITG